MKKKLIILILIIFWAQSIFSEPDFDGYRANRENIINSNPNVEDSVMYLVNLKQLGYDYSNIYLRIILKDENAAELLKTIFKESKDNAGKIRALNGLYYLESSSYNKLKRKLSGNITIFRGCFLDTKKVKEYLKEYESKSSIENFINQSESSS